MLSQRWVKRLRYTLMAGCILLLCSLSSCWQWNLRSTPAVSGSRLALASQLNPKTFNYIVNYEFPSVFQFIDEGLTRRNGITGEIEPALAESWKFSSDRTQVLFKLRPNLQWSDGHPLTADDVVFTYEKILFNSAIPTGIIDQFRVGKNREFPRIKKLDRQQVVFTFPEPFAPFLFSTIGPPDGTPILPKHALEKFVTELDSEGRPKLLLAWGTDTPPSQVIVNGPYQIERFDLDQRVIFKRNPFYWRRDSEKRQLPYIDRILWQIVDSLDTQLLKFRSGELDILGDSQPLRAWDFILLKKEQKRRQLQIFNGGSWSGVTFLAFNLTQAQDENRRPFVNPIKSQWFNTQAFRQAIAYAINRDNILNYSFQGLGIIQNSPLSSYSPYYLSPEEGLPVYSYNPTHAKELLLQAGFHYNSNHQLLDRHGNPVRFRLLAQTGDKQREAMGVQIKNHLAAIGIQVDLSLLELSTFINQLIVTRDWDTILLAAPGGIEPHTGAGFWLSTGDAHLFNLGSRSGQRPVIGRQVSAWEQEVDRLVTAGAKEFDPQKRKAIYSKFQILIQEQVPVIHLVNEMSL